MRKNTCLASFPNIVSQFLTPQVWKKAHQAWTAQHAESRWLLPATVWVVLGMAWCCGDTLDERFATARAVYVAAHPKLRRPGKSLTSFLRALERLPMPVLRALSEAMRERLSDFVDASRINGWVAMACDGTRAECPRSQQLQARLGTCGKPDSAPMVYLTALVLLPLGLPWSWRWGKGNANEQEHLRRLLPTLPERALLVADAFYQGYELFNDIRKAGAHFVVRMSSRSCLYTADDACLERFQEGPVYYWPENSARSKNKPPVQGRLLRVRGKKGDVWLFTSVLERRELSRKTAAQVYRWRWRNEGLFRQYKRLLGKTKLQSRTVSLVHREGEGAMLALQLLLAHAALKMQVGHRLVLVMESPRRTLLQIRAAMKTALRLLGPRQWTSYCRQLETVRQGPQTRASPRTRQEWTRRKDHKPPKPPDIRVLDKTLKTKLQKTLKAG
jgi:hypothetical protein